MSHVAVSMCDYGFNTIIRISLERKISLMCIDHSLLNENILKVDE